MKEEQSAKEGKAFENELDVSFWNQRWITGQTGWDIGQASPPIVQFMNQFEDKQIAILIPGCGNAYEAAFLTAQGFANITLLDIAPEAVAILRSKFAQNNQVKIICGDFFEHKGKYDLIIEQTFFCAQVLEKREAYVQRMTNLLNPKGILMGVLFDVDFEKQGPPFGGSAEEYQNLFEQYFHIKKLEPCYNSIVPRQGNELFIHFVKKD